MSVIRGEQLAGNSTKPAKIKPGSAYQVVRTNSGATEAEWGAVALNQSNAVQGVLPLANGGTGANLADPNADRIVFWDDSGGALTWLEVGTGLSITGTTLAATGGATITVQEGDATVDAAVTTLDFGPGFDVTSSPAGEANIALDLTETGRADAGAVYATQVQDASANEVVAFLSVGAAVNYVEIGNQSTGNGPKVAAAGDDTDVTLNLQGKGTGDVEIASHRVNHVTVRGAGAGNSPYVMASGSDTNIDLLLEAQGTGVVKASGGAVYYAGGTDVALADGGTGASLADPGADRVMFWDDSGGAVDWLSPSSPLSISGTSLVLGTVAEANGGTNQTTYTTGDLLYASAANTLAKRGIGSTDDLLTVSGGVPAWAAPKVRTVRITGTPTTTSTTPVDVSNLSFSLTANRYYSYQFWIRYQTGAVGTGIGLSMDYTGTSTYHLFGVRTHTDMTASGAPTFRAGRADDAISNTTGVDASSTNMYAFIDGMILPTSSATLIVRMQSETGTAVGIYPGTCGTLYDMGA